MRANPAAQRAVRDSARARPSIVTPSEAAGAEINEAEEIPQAASLLPDGVIGDGEIIVLMLRPSLLFIPLSCGTSLTLAALVGSLGAYLARTVAWVPWTDTHAFALALAFVIARLARQSLEWYSRVYVLTDRRIIRRRGVLRMALFEAPLRNIQHTSIFARLREQVFGLGTIGFATSGSDFFEAYWIMIRHPFKVHRTVTEAIERARRR